MTRVVYVNGRYLPYAHACVHVEDRGFQFADSVYEVCEVFDGKLIDVGRHLARLSRSLNELQIEKPINERALCHVMQQTVQRNRVRFGTLYLQVSRGHAARDFAFPEPPVQPTLVCLARATPRSALREVAKAGIAVITQPDPRWQRCDIKTVMLLPAVLAKHAAQSSGAREVWFVDREGQVTEGASSTAWIITGDGRVLTRALSQEILPGVTRATLLDQLSDTGLTIEQRAFSVAEAEAAREAFQTSASGTVLAVTRINATKIGDGTPGPVTRRLRDKFHEFAEFT